MPEEQKKIKIKRESIQGAQYYDRSNNRSNEMRKYLDSITKPDYPYRLSKIQIQETLGYIKMMEMGGGFIPENWRIFKMRYSSRPTNKVTEFLRKMREDPGKAVLYLPREMVDTTRQQPAGNELDASYAIRGALGKAGKVQNKEHGVELMNEIRSVMSKIEKARSITRGDVMDALAKYSITDITYEDAVTAGNALRGKDAEQTRKAKSVSANEYKKGGFEFIPGMGYVDPSKIGQPGSYSSMMATQGRYSKNLHAGTERTLSQVEGNSNPGLDLSLSNMKSPFTLGGENYTDLALASGLIITGVAPGTGSAMLGMNFTNFMLEKIGVSKRLAIGLELEGHVSQPGMGGKVSALLMYYGHWGNSNGETFGIYAAGTGSMIVGGEGLPEDQSPYMWGGMGSIGLSPVVAYGSGGSEGISHYGHEIDINLGSLGGGAIGISDLPDNMSFKSYLSSETSAYATLEIGIKKWSWGKGYGITYGKHMVLPIFTMQTNGTYQQYWGEKYKTLDYIDWRLINNE